MRKGSKKILSMLLMLAVSFTMVFGSTGFAQAASYSKTKAAFEKCGDYLYNEITQNADGTDNDEGVASYGSIGGEWLIYGFGHAGYKISDKYLASYKQSVLDALKEGFRGTTGILHDKKFTDYSRVIVALSAEGIDASKFEGYDLTAPLADFVNVKWQGMNGPIWALIALDSGDYDIPKRTDSYAYGTLDAEETDRQNTRQKMIDYILANQFDDGGWNVQPREEGSTGYNAVSDVDMTGMAMIALGPYMSQKKVKTAVDKAIAYLSDAQQDDGGFQSWGTSNSESCSQAICGLLACGVNPNTDSRFIKNGNSVLDALMSFYTEETDKNTGETICGFRHVNKASDGYEPTYNQMATEQAYYALAFFYKSVPAQTSLSKAVKSASGKIKLTWKKAAIATDYVTIKSGKTASASGYQIICATDKNFKKNVKKVTVSSSSATSKTITGLKKGKTYYVKVRAYKTVNGKKIYGLYSTVKSCKA